MKTSSDLMLSDYAYAHGTSSHIASEGYDIKHARHKVMEALHPRYSPGAIESLIGMHDVIHGLICPKVEAAE